MKREWPVHTGGYTVFLAARKSRPNRTADFPQRNRTHTHKAQNLCENLPSVCIHSCRERENAAARMFLASVNTA